MISRRARLRYAPYGLVGIGVVVIWYGLSGPRLSLALVGLTAALGAGYVIASGYTATSLAAMCSGLALSGLVGAVVTLATEGLTGWVAAYLLLAAAGGRRGRQYWLARPWSPEDAETEPTRGD